MLIIRQFFYDWDHEVPATMRIDRLTSSPARSAARSEVAPDAATARQLVAAGAFVEANLDFFLAFANPAVPNSFNPPFDGTGMGAAAENRPVIGSWKLQSDEALLVEVTPPIGLYWSLSIGNVWWETIDYAEHITSLNGHQAVLRRRRVPRGHRAPRSRGRELDRHRRPHRGTDDPALRPYRIGAGADDQGRSLRRARRRAPTEYRTRAHLSSAPHDRRSTCGGRAAIRTMSVDVSSLDPDALEAAARSQTNLDDFGDGSHREGLERFTAALRDEADLSSTGVSIMSGRITALLVTRLQVEQTYRDHPEIADEVVDGPVFVIGLPRTGTTALSQLVAADPQMRSLRLWESAAPVPPPETATEHTDPRIAATEQGLELMYDAFPRMRTLYHQEATTATECQDLLGMSFRTMHFDGYARVPSYVRWVRDADMRSTYAYHHKVLRLLQWHCPPRLWHLKTPVHMFALDDLLASYPNARFLWSHRDPAAVLASVCDLIAYTRSWVSDRDDSSELGAGELALWAEAVRRAWTSGRAWEPNPPAGSPDIAHADLQTDPVGAVAAHTKRLVSTSRLRPSAR